MPRTKTPGITINGAGHPIIDKEHRGVRIYVRLGPVSEEEAQRRLTAELQRIELELQQKANARPRFVDAAARNLEESRDKRTVDVATWHAPADSVHWRAITQANTRSIAPAARYASSLMLAASPAPD